MESANAPKFRPWEHPRPMTDPSPFPTSPSAEMDIPAVRAWRFALFTFFFVIGVAMASWVTRTPTLRDTLQASIAQMGLVLFGLSVGAMSGLLAATALVNRFGTRRVAIGGLLSVVVGVAGIGLGALLAAAWLVCIGLFFFGMGMGTSEIGINMDGAEVERRLERPVLTPLHGCFSLGTLCGAMLGIALNAVAFPVHWHLLGVALLALAAVAKVAQGLPRAQAPDPATASDVPAATSRASLWSDRRLLMIGVIIMAMALAEGAANDWLPILMVDEHGFDPTSGSLIYAGFALGMTIGRFCGGYVLLRVRRDRVMLLSTVSCAIGVALAIFSQHPVLAAVSVLFWGLGASLGFPLAISAAGDSGADAARRVGFVSIAGYFSFLVGPPLLGFIGEHHGLRAALGLVLVLALVAVFMAGATRTARRGASPIRAADAPLVPVGE